MTADLHDLLGPYTLGALDELERARFKAHLVRCGRCQLELVSFKVSAARLNDVDLPPDVQ